jgi:hypothetical protein
MITFESEKEIFILKYFHQLYCFFLSSTINCVIVDVSMHCKNLSFLEFFVTSNHIEVLFYMKKKFKWMKLIRMVKVIFFKKINNNFLFNNQPIHYTKCFSIGSCKNYPLCISSSSYFKIYIYFDNWLVGNSNKLIPSGSLKSGKIQLFDTLV